MNESVIIKTEYGVVVELRHWGQDKTKWLDWHAHEWQLLPGGSWEEQDWRKAAGHSGTRARELGRWSGSVDLYEAARLAQQNTTGFRNFPPGRAA